MQGKRRKAKVIEREWTAEMVARTQPKTYLGTLHLAVRMHGAHAAVVTIAVTVTTVVIGRATGTTWQERKQSAGEWEKNRVINSMCHRGWQKNCWKPRHACPKLVDSEEFWHWISEWDCLSRQMEAEHTRAGHRTGSAGGVAVLCAQAG